MMSSWESYHFDSELFMIECVKTDLYELNIFNKVKQNSKLHSHNNICICAVKK
jgi:hypothetical protein